MVFPMGFESCYRMPWTWTSWTRVRPLPCTLDQGQAITLHTGIEGIALTLAALLIAELVECEELRDAAFADKAMRLFGFSNLDGLI